MKKFSLIIDITLFPKFPYLNLYFNCYSYSRTQSKANMPPQAELSRANRIAGSGF